MEGLILPQQSMPRRSLLTVEQFAVALGLAPKTIRMWVWRKEVSFVKVGGAVRFRPETLEQVIKRGEVPAMRPVARRIAGRTEDSRTDTRTSG